MTEKRFTVEEMQNWNKRYKLSSDTSKVIDTYDGGEYWTVHGNEAYNLCIDMNALFDENEQLKQFLQSLAEQSVNGKVMLRDGKVYDLNKILKKGDVE